MLTLFTCPKAFSGHIDVIQRNALRSWARLRPQPQVLLMGDDPGTQEAAREFDFEFLPSVGRNEFGTPLVSDIFAQAQSRAKNEVMCYINADMILSSDFMRALAFVVAQKRRFLMVNRRWNLDIRAPLDFDAPDWDAQWPAYVRKNGKLDGNTAIDFFVFSRGLYPDVPPFAIGRTLWDNWLLFEARHRRAIMVDTTPVVAFGHQNHDYAHVTSNPGDAWKGPERDKNNQLMGDMRRVFTIGNATHRVIKTASGLALQSTLSEKSLGQIVHEFTTTRDALAPLGQIARNLSLIRRARSRND